MLNLAMNPGLDRWIRILPWSGSKNYWSGSETRIQNIGSDTSLKIGYNNKAWVPQYCKIWLHNPWNICGSRMEGNMKKSKAFMKNLFKCQSSEWVNTFYEQEYTTSRKANLWDPAGPQLEAEGCFESARRCRCRTDPDTPRPWSSGVCWPKLSPASEAMDHRSRARRRCVLRRDQVPQRACRIPWPPAGREGTPALPSYRSGSWKETRTRRQANGAVRVGGGPTLRPRLACGPLTGRSRARGRRRRRRRRERWLRRAREMREEESFEELMRVVPVTGRMSEEREAESVD